MPSTWILAVDKKDRRFLVCKVANEELLHDSM